MNTATSNTKPIVLITGGSGFLGKAIVRELLDPSSPIKAKEIRVFDIVPYKSENAEKIKFIKGDIQDYTDVEDACKGVDLIFHSAAIVDWGTREEKEVYSINVGGTQNIINACRKHTVNNLIFTSSLDAVYSPKNLVDIDESQEYPDKIYNAYCGSKIRGEELIIKANSEELKTCILRPADVYGEDDPYHMPPLIDMVKSGFYIRLGNGKAKCQHVYVGNMAHAHILAGLALLNNNAKVYGQIYLITDGPASNFFKFFDRIVLAAAYKITPKNLWLPEGIAYPMAALTEFGAFLISPIKKYNVKFSRFAVKYTCSDFTFKSNKAKTDFNFIPKYTTDESIARTAKFYHINKN